MLVLLTLCLAVGAFSHVVVKDHKTDSEWKSWRSTHRKTYPEEEEVYRYKIWQANKEYIEAHNTQKEDHGFDLRMNRFGDLTNQEYRLLWTGYRSSSRTPSNRQLHVVPEVMAPPEQVDWRTKGYVTDVKDQGQCGSCWAFSTTGSVEGQHFKSTGKLVSLSEQDLVDCSSSYGNQGCNGGLMDQAFQYIIANHGVDTEDSYPYTARDGKCKSKKGTIGATISSFIDIASGNETALLSAVLSVGPVSVAIDAGHSSFQFYHSGVYYEPSCSPTELDHGVLAVGYGTEGGKDYWIVKNSWGPGWGASGYINMSRNKKNNCGIATAASYPVV